MIDVESLYMSIPGVAHFLGKKFLLQGAHNEFVVETLEFMLNHNFQFLGTSYQQLRGTSMGAPWAPAYACLHLGLWEEEIIYVYLRHSLLWIRYINDVLMLWGGLQ